MTKKTILFLFFIFPLQITFQNAFAQTNTERIEAIVESLPRGTMNTAIYWFEMDTALGWEKMMVIFGYANNLPVCNKLVEISNLDAPFRRFRCTPAN